MFWNAEGKRIHGEKMKFNGVRRKMSLKSSIYQKYNVVIEMLISKLNENIRNEYDL